jgi:hypothetical protein
MSLYFLVHDATLFHREIVPALAASWRQRNFDPCRPLAASLAPAVHSFAQRYFTSPAESILFQVEKGLPFDRSIWTCLAGEVLLLAAKSIPEIQTTPDTLGRILAPDRCREENLSRAGFTPIQQAHFGTRDLTFGGRLYRPEQAGWNDADDVARLASYLDGIDPQTWSTADLAGLPGLEDEEERQEELELVREWFPELQTLYRQARQERHIIVCEVI